MNPIINEVQAVQNPALGATLIWRFACGYSPESSGGDGVPLILAFLVLPIVLHAKTREGVEATQRASGARKFEQKFDDSGDLLLAINERAIAMRSLSLRSLRFALSCELLTLLPERAALWPRTYTAPKGTAKSVEGLMKASEKLGAWCSPLTLFEVAGLLRVEM